MRQILRLCFALFFAFSLFGCSTINMSKSDLNGIQAISVNRQVDMPKSAIFHGIATNFKHNGVVGASISEIDRPTDVVLTDFLASEKISVQEILLTEFSKALENTVLSSKVKPNGTHSLTLKVSEFGLGKGWGFANNMKPIMTALVSLVDSNGKVIWRQEGVVDGFNTELPSRSLEDWMKDPTAMRESFELASKIVVTNILKGFDRR